MVAAGEASEKGRERESERQRRLKEILWNVRGVVWVEEYGKRMEEPLEERQQMDEMYVREEWRK